MSSSGTRGTSRRPEYRSPGAGEGVGTQLEAQRSSRGPPGWVTGALVVVLLGLAACATGDPMGGRLAGNYRYNPLTPPESPEARERAAKARVEKARAAVEAKGEVPTDVPKSTATGEQERVAEGGVEGRTVGNERAGSHRRRAAAAEDAVEGEGKGVGWWDGVGDGRPYEVPFSVDYFQGFLQRAVQ
jgi:hypothetical protein